MSDEIQETVERIDELLQSALKDANIYTSHDEVRPSAVRGFDKVEEARILLDEIDERDFNDD